MKDSGKFGLGLFVSTILIIVDVALLLTEKIEVGIFAAILILSLIFLIIPILLFRKRRISLSETSIDIAAPFVSIDIPYESVLSIHTFNSIKLTLRTFGYGGISVRCGEFIHSTLGSVVCACDEKIPMFIMIVTEKKKVILNLESLDSTKLLLSQIESQCGKKAVKEEYVLSDEEKRKNKRNTRIAIGAFVSVIAIVAVIVIIVMSIGSVNVILTDTDMEIDATMMNKTIPYSEIDSVEIVTDLDYGYRVAGTSNSKVLTGSFENDDFGRYYLAVYKDVSESIVVHTAEKVYVVNLVDSESTVNLYNELLTRLNLS